MSCSSKNYSDEDDLAFARSLEPLFRDSRYIRINGRPLLLIYRPGHFPDAAKTVERWRAHFISAGLGDPYIAMVQTWGAAKRELRHGCRRGVSALLDLF